MQKNKFLYLVLLLLASVLPLYASTMTDNTTTTINDRQCFDITYNEPSTQAVGSITLLLNIDHTRRSDLEITLTSPSGTTIDIIDRRGDDSDNLYVLFHDDASMEIEDDFTSHTSTVEREPDDNFSDFDGELVQGIWTLRICDRARGDTGRYNSSTLDITTVPAPLDFTTNNTRPFSKIPIAGNINTNIAGDLLVIGNQSLCSTDQWGQCTNPGSTANNNDVVVNHANLDPVAVNSGFVNSTSADLVLNPNDVIIEAWLFWAGRHNPSSGITDAQRMSSGTIQLRTPTTNGAYVQITTDSDKFGWTDDGRFDYSAAANVTEFVQQGGTYWVADLQATSGIDNQGSGWALAIVVEDRGFPQLRTVKNISLYSGFIVAAQSQASTNITGFLTPKTGPINATLITFATESDRNLPDSISITNPTGTEIFLTDSFNDPNNVQNATVSLNGENVTARNPNFENTLGVDIDQISLNDIIEHNQTSTTITITSPNTRDADFIYLSMFGFATDLYIPEVCYDYTVSRNGLDITRDNREIISYDGNLTIAIALKSLEGDFDFENTQISVRLSPTENTEFKNAFYSPNNVNTYLQGIFTPNSTSLRPTIGIGEDLNIDIDGFTTGGIIKTNQRYFSKFDYTIENHLEEPYQGQFEVDLNMTINFGSGDVPIYKSTQSSNIPRCAQSLVYRPQRSIFNVERQDTQNLQNENEKYPLWTQVVGKPFDFDVVAYDSSYENEVAIGQTEVHTIDLELIDADPFNDEDNVFTCSNTETVIVKPLDSTGRRHTFVRFDGLNTRVNMNNIETDTALRNAAFRMWYLVDANGSIIPHNCPDPQDDLTGSNSCFEDLYTQYWEEDDNITNADGTVGFCGSTSKYGSCSNYQNVIAGTQGCYACMRDHFATFVCSRDNFAIRPASYRVTLSDNLEDVNATLQTGSMIKQNTDTLSARLAAGYRYRVSGLATSYDGDTIPAFGYNTLFSDLFNNDLTSLLAFDTDNNPTTCFDQNSTSWSINFDGGIIQPKLLNHNNVGNYLYNIVDNNWTIVDQARYAYKTFPGVNDCIVNTNTITTSNTGMNGCVTDSNINVNGSSYTNMPLSFYPYRFDIGTVSLQVLDNNSSYIFMNDFENEAYNDPTVRPLSMSVAFIGDVIARAKGGEITTNFNEDCAAVDLELHLDKNVSRSSNGLITDLTASLLSGSLPEDEVNSVSGLATENALVFQQYLQESNDSTDAIDTINRVTAPDGNTTIRASAFSDTTDNGTASIRLHTNFKKPLEEGVERLVNPIDINYTMLTVSAPDANSSADGIANYIPDGNNTYNRSIRALFSRVVFAQPLYDNILTDFILATAFVEIYCTDTAILNCANDYRLDRGTQELSNQAGWFTTASDNNNSNYYNPLVDGNAIFTPQVTHGSTTPLVYGTNPSPSQPFDGPNAPNGTMTDINVSVPANAGRPLTIDVTIGLEPYHRFFIANPEGTPQGRFNFIGPSSWSGVGDTGMTTQATSSNNNPRMSW